MIQYIGMYGNLDKDIIDSYYAICDCSFMDDIDGVLLNINITADSKLVVSSKSMLGGHLVRDLSYARIKSMPYRYREYLPILFSFFNKDRYFYYKYRDLYDRSGTISTLCRVLDGMCDDKCLMFRICDDEGNLFYDKLVSVLNMYHYQDRDIVFMSSSYDTLFKLKDRLPYIRIVLDVCRGYDFKSFNHDIDGVSMHYSMLDNEVIDKMIMDNKMLCTWDKHMPFKHYKEVVKYLSSYDIDVINNDLDYKLISDFPVKAMEYTRRLVRK